jgi:aspartate/methionine/tyrosine aminotransferase
MQIKPFKLERYFAQYEFSARYLLSASDCESLSLQELLRWADDEALELWRGLRLGYTESQGHPLLRQEIARQYERLTPDDVLVLSPIEGIFIAMNALLEPDDHVIVVSPAYQSLYEVARSLGCWVTGWEIEPRGNQWHLDVERLKRSILIETKLLVLNFPHNPSGYLPSLDQLQAILDLARQRELYVFSDEMYRLLEYDPAHRLPTLCDLYDRAVVLSGLSKTFSLPGLRIGWLATPDRVLLEKLQVLKDYTTICNSAPSEILGLMALRAQETIVQRNLDIIRHNLDVAERFFARHDACFEWRRPRAGSVAFVRWTGGTPVDEFCQDVLEQQDVLIVPGSMFDFPGNYFRIGLGRKDFPRAIERVRDYMRRTT